MAATSKLRKYLLGRRFILTTDHRPLETLLSQTTNKLTIARIERWKEKLTMYDYDIRYIKGESHIIADFLSRTAGKTLHDEVSLQEELVINHMRENDLEKKF